MGKVLISVFAALTALSALVGCSSGGCTENQTCVPRAGFYSYNTGNKITVDSLEIGGVGAPGDSLLVSGNAGQTLLPLRANYPSASFFIRYTAHDLAFFDIVDTIFIDYTTIPYFADEDCGAMYRYTINRLTHTSELIDSVALVDSIVTNVDLEQIQIFFRTGE